MGVVFGVAVALVGGEGEDGLPDRGVFGGGGCEEGGEGGGCRGEVGVGCWHVGMSEGMSVEEGRVEEEGGELGRFKDGGVERDVGDIEC